MKMLSVSTMLMNGNTNVSVMKAIVEMVSAVNKQI
jgi:hypothetical protein